MAEYRRHFPRPGAPAPDTSWPRQVPLAGRETEVSRIVENYGRWLSHTHVPKLLINADPGILLIGRAREFCCSWLNLTEVTVRDTFHPGGQPRRDRCGASRFCEESALIQLRKVQDLRL